VCVRVSTYVQRRASATATSDGSTTEEQSAPLALRRVTVHFTAAVCCAEAAAVPQHTAAISMRGALPPRGALAVVLSAAARQLL
jgi:hypothetical protein